MRAPVNSLRADLVRTTAAARERLAGEHFGKEKLRAAVTEGAAGGFEQATIAGPDGVDLRETATVKTTLVWVADMKLDHTWEPRSGSAVTSYDLVISWRPRAVG